MSEEIHTKIVRFLTEEANRELGRSLVALELAAAQPGMAGSSQQTWYRTEEPDLFEGQAQLEGLASKIIQIAEEYARDIGGAQRFELRTTQHLGGKRRTSFRIECDLGSEDGTGGGGGGGMIEPPNATGLTGQLMRHLEVKDQTMARMFHTMLGTMSATIRDQAAENERMRRDRAASFTELENHRSQQAQRDLELLEADALNKRKDQLFGEVTKLLPVVASRFATGGDDAPASAEFSALKVLLAQFGQSLTEEQKVKIAAALTPSQGMVLMEAFRVVGQSAGQPHGSSNGQLSGQEQKTS